MTNPFLKAILNSRPSQSLQQKADTITLPGFEGATLLQVIKFLIKELNHTHIIERTAAVTYNFIMALPPTFLFLFSLIPYLPLKNVEQTLLQTLKLISPNKAIYRSFSTVIRDFLHNEHKDILSIGILMVLFFSSNGMIGLMKTFDKSRALYKKRSALKRRWTAIKLTIMLILLFIVTIAILILQNKSINHLIIQFLPSMVIANMLSFSILIGLMFVTYSMIYKYGPSLTHPLKFVSPGSIFATAASLISTWFFFYMVNNFLHYNKVYGSIGTLMAFMVLVWLNTFIILLGYELNISILLGKLSKERPKNTLNEA